MGELLKGTVVCPLSLYPSLYHCWPYPRQICAVQALLLPLLHQQTAMTLSLLSVDQYCCILHPGPYSRYVTRASSALIVLGSWLVSIGWYAALYLPVPVHFYFSHLHSYSCEPYHTAHAQLIVAACALYFLTTMVTMYSYGTVFHLVGSSLQTLVCSSIAAPQILGMGKEKVAEAWDRQQCLRSGRVLAVLSMFFIILITPWTLRQIIVGCTNYRVPGGVDYSVWLLGQLTGSLLLVLLWLLSPVLRASTRDTLYNRVCCGNVLLRDLEEPCHPSLALNGGGMLRGASGVARPLRYSPAVGASGVGSKRYPLVSPNARREDTLRKQQHRPSSPDDASSSGGLPTPPLPPAARAAAMRGAVPAPRPPLLANGRPPPLARGPHTGSCDLEAASEKYWGEILERAVSYSSLHSVRLQHPEQYFSTVSRQPTARFAP